MTTNNWTMIPNPTDAQTADIKLNYLTGSNLKYLDSKNKEYYELIAIKKRLIENHFTDSIKPRINTTIEQEPWILEWLQSNLNHPILTSFEAKQIEVSHISIDQTNNKSYYIDEEMKLASKMDGVLRFTLPDTYEFSLPFEIKITEMSFNRIATLSMYQLQCNMRFLQANKILLIVANPRSKTIEMGWVLWDENIWNDLIAKINTFWIDFSNTLVKEPTQDLKECMIKYQLIQSNIKQLNEQKEQLEKILYTNPIMNKEFMIVSTIVKRYMPKSDYIKDFIAKNKLPFDMFYEPKNAKFNKIYYFGKED